MSKRPVSPGMEKILGEKFNVLDYGFVRVVDYMGNDAAIVQAARVSYGEGTKSVSSDEALINYLMRNWHSSPFEMCEIKIHVKLPIFVARQWIRHRTANVNEVSARYSVLAKEFYIPQPENICSQSKNNKQGRGEAVPRDFGVEAAEIFQSQMFNAYSAYEDLLNGPDAPNYIEEMPSIARELSRIVLPSSIYTEWYWKVDLHNLMHFLQLRTNPHAQMEIRVYADALLNILGCWVPLTYRAFRDKRLEAFTLTGNMVEYLRTILRADSIDDQNRADARLSRREKQEMMDALSIS